MKLQSQISRKYGEKEYKKSWVVIPEKLLKKLGWKTGEDLEAEVKMKKLIIKNL